MSAQQEWITEIDEVNYDTIFLGSSLTNCIGFAALSRAGKKVLLLDTQATHGYTNSTVTLKDYHNMVRNINTSTANNNTAPRSSSNPTHVDLLEESPEELARQAARYQSRQRDGEQEEKIVKADILSVHDLLNHSVERYQRYCVEKDEAEAAKKKKAEKQQDAQGGCQEEEEEAMYHHRNEYGAKQSAITAEALFNSENQRTSSYLAFPTAHFLSLAQQKQHQCQQQQQQQHNNTHKTTNVRICNEFTPHTTHSSQYTPQPYPIHNAYEYIQSSHQPLSTLIPSLTQLFTQYQKFQQQQQQQQEDEEQSNTNTNPPTTSPEELTNTSPQIDFSTINFAQCKQQQAQLEQLQQLIAKSGYRYSIDLIPHAIYAKSVTIKTLLYAKVHEYMEFRAVNRMLLLLAETAGPTGSYKPWEIPSSKNEIFVDPVLSIKAKHRLTTLFLIILNDPKNAQTTQYHLDLYQKFKHFTLYHLLYHLYINSKIDFHDQQHAEAQGVNINHIQARLKKDKDLQLLIKLLLSGICHTLTPALSDTSINNNAAKKDTTNSAALLLPLYIVSQHLQQHLASIGKYTKSPLLYPSYGVGELSQAWIRNGCVWGGTAVIRSAVGAVLLSEEGTNQVFVTLSTGQVLSAKALVMDRAVAPMFISTQQQQGQQQEQQQEQQQHQQQQQENTQSPPQCELVFFHKDYATLYDKEYIPQAQVNSNEQPPLLSSTKPKDITTQMESQVLTTQHITVIANKIPSHFLKGYEDQPENASIQLFHADHVDPRTNIVYSSKYLVLDGQNGMTSNNHYIFNITTTLRHSHLPKQTHAVNDIIEQFNDHINTTAQHFDAQHAQSVVDGNVQNVLPQLAPFLTPCGDGEDIKLFYIGAFCQTNYRPILTQQQKKCDATQWSGDVAEHISQSAVLMKLKLNGNLHDNIFVSLDADPSTTSPDQYSIQAQAMYYNMMEYFYEVELKKNQQQQQQQQQQQPASCGGVDVVEKSKSELLKYSLLPFLMTQNDDIIIDEETGEVLETLEHRNPQLAHAIGVIEQLESTLQNIEQDGEEEKKRVLLEEESGQQQQEQEHEEQQQQNDNNGDDEGVVMPQQDHNTQQNIVDNAPAVEKKGNDLVEGDDLFLALDNLDLSELGGLDL